MKRIVKSSTYDDPFKEFCHTVYKNMEDKYGFAPFRVYRNNKGKTMIQVNVSGLSLDRAVEVAEDLKIVAEDAKLYETNTYN